MSASEEEDGKGFGSEDAYEDNSDDTDSDDSLQHLGPGFVEIDSVESYCLVLAGLITKIIHARGTAKPDNMETGGLNYVSCSYMLGNKRIFSIEKEREPHKTRPNLTLLKLATTLFILFWSKCQHRRWNF